MTRCYTWNWGFKWRINIIASIIAQLQPYNRPAVALLVFRSILQCFAAVFSPANPREVWTYRWNKRRISQTELPGTPSSRYYRVQPPNNVGLQHLIPDKWSICPFFHTGRQRLSPALGSVLSSVSYDKTHIMWFWFRGNNWEKMGWIQINCCYTEQPAGAPLPITVYA